MRELIIDRFEETYVVCQTPDGQLDAFPRKRLPENAKEGSWLIVYDDGTVEVDEEKTIRHQLANMYRLKNMLKRRKDD